MQIDKLIDSVFTVLPIIHKKILKDIKFAGFTKQQAGLLFTVKKHDSMPMSFYSDHLMMPRPNLTLLADKLFEDGFIERVPDPNDRRVISLEITEKGNEYMDNFIAHAKNELSKKLESLDEKDVAELNDSVGIILNVLNKL